MAKAQGKKKKKLLEKNSFFFLTETQAWACLQCKMEGCGVHKFSLQDLLQIPKQYSCSGLLMANTNFEMIVLCLGLSLLPDLMHMYPQGDAIIISFHYLQNRDNSSTSYLHQEQSHAYQETLQSQQKNSLEIQHKNSKLSHCFCLAVSPEG